MTIPNIDTRILATVIWGAGTFIVWGAVFLKTVANWRLYKDRRARHDVLGDGALFLVALASAAAIGFGLLIPPDTEGRSVVGLVGSIALGAFTMAGVVKLTESPPRPPDTTDPDDTSGHWWTR